MLEFHGRYRLKNKNKILQIKSQKNIIVVVVVVKLNTQYTIQNTFTIQKRP